MDRPIIEAQNLSKHYQLGAIGASSLRESAERLWQRFRGTSNGATPPASPARRLSPARTGGTGDTFWALRDVSFSVRKGEIVGIIGRNGAGKSTLLKILSRITEPSSGRAILRGRVGSLLEVGTGFHPELSGRENIYLNGAMLGMRTAEIARKFDEIIAFSEVEDFVDTPVKRYSSGMYVRLAFAVAAHLEPEILLVDEVLAVGDVAFQKKCLGKMDDVAKAGRTVLLVSHAMPSILALCPRVICVADGGISADGPAREVVQEFLQTSQAREIATLEEREDRHGDGSTRMVELRIEAEDGGVVRPTSRLKITIAYRGAKPLRQPKFVISIYDYGDAGLFLLDSDAAGGLPEVLPAEGEVVCVTEPIHLTPGRCYVNLRLLKGGALADYVPQAGIFDVEPDAFHGSGKIPGRDHVLFLLRNQWSIETPATA